MGKFTRISNRINQRGKPHREVICDRVRRKMRRAKKSYDKGEITIEAYNLIIREQQKRLDFINR